MSKVISRKLFTFLTATGLMIWTDLSSDTWGMIAMVYIGTQGAVDVMKAYKYGEQMTWMTLALHAKKIWVWCKYHWKIIAIAAWTLLIWIVARKNVRAYKKVLNTTIENYKKEIEVIENNHNAEVEKRNEAIHAHREALAKLEESYAGSLNDLTIEKRARYLELLELYNQDPENINKALEAEFGFRYIE